VSLYLVCGSSETFFPVIIIALTKLDLLAFSLEFDESGA
jgi:hypothetical protein